MNLTEWEAASLAPLKYLPHLSREEVQTPVKMALDVVGCINEEIIGNPKSKYLVLGSKDGIFAKVLEYRLMHEMQGEFANEREKIEHILHHQIFVYCTSELAADLSRKTLYGDVDARRCGFQDSNGLVKFASDADSQWWKPKDRDETCDTALNEVFGLKFDAIIGNPPYQAPTAARSESIAQATPIYNLVVEGAAKLHPKQLVMIIPSRWMTGGWGLDKFRTFMSNGHVDELHDYENAADCFRSVDIKGGVCWFSYRPEYSGNCLFVEHHADGTVHSESRPMMDGFDAVVRRAECLKILKHLKQFDRKPFSSIVSAMNCFGITHKQVLQVPVLPEDAPGTVKIYGYDSGGMHIWNVDGSIVKACEDAVGKWKVFIAKAAGTGSLATDVFRPIVAGPGTACTWTYLMIGPFDTQEEAESAASYVRTKLAHLCIGILKDSHNVLRQMYRFLPLVDFRNGLWTDKRVFEEFSLPADCIQTVDGLIWT